MEQNHPFECIYCNEYDYDRNTKIFETVETDSIADVKGENP